MKARIIPSKEIEHSELKGTTVREMWGGPIVGKPQDVLVTCEPHTEIPLHTHTVRARMYGVSGTATVLSADTSINGKKVGPGDEIFFEASIPHGFKAGPEGYIFVSKNEGIVGNQGWDINFV